MKVLCDMYEVIHQEMQERVVTESKATDHTPSKEITCQSHRQPKQWLCSWTWGAGVSSGRHTLTREQMTTATYFLLTTGKPCYPTAFAPLPQFTSQNSWFQKLNQSLQFPMKTEIIGKASSLSPEGVLFLNILKGRGEFSNTVKIFWHFPDQNRSNFQLAATFYFQLQNLPSNASWNRSALHYPALYFCSLWDEIGLILFVVASSSLYANQETAASCHFPQHSHMPTKERSRCL